MPRAAPSPSCVSKRRPKRRAGSTSTSTSPTRGATSPRRPRSRLVEAYAVELAVHVITPPASDVDPQPDAAREARGPRRRSCSPSTGTSTSPVRRKPIRARVRDVGTRARSASGPAADQLRAALELGAALWAERQEALAKLLGTWGTESSSAVAPILNANYEDAAQGRPLPGRHARVRRRVVLGHRSPAATSRQRSRATPAAASRTSSRRGPRPIAARSRSPTSRWPARCGSRSARRTRTSRSSRSRPCSRRTTCRSCCGRSLPMVTRGMPLPNVKRMYIVRDAKREADRLGIPFGEICDPLGTGVDNCIAIAHWADAARRAAAVREVRDARRSGPRRATWPSTSICATSSSAPELPWAEAKAALGRPEAAEVGARPTPPISP